MKFVLSAFGNRLPQQEVAPISREDYSKLVEKIERLEAEAERLKERVKELEKGNTKLREENAQLRRRLGLNSTNSSRPPSTDPPSVRYPSRTHPDCRLPPQSG